ncbi:hypothetical protein AHAS_Ahas19G0266400 [Arachis hypogaea]
MWQRLTRWAIMTGVQLLWHGCRDPWHQGIVYYPVQAQVSTACDRMTIWGQEVKEALRAQMEVQSKLHLLVEVNFFFMLNIFVL